MFDIAYTPEASVEAARIGLENLNKEKDKTLLDLLWEDKFKNGLTYWEIWYGTHGV